MITVTKKITICFLVLFSYQLLYSQVPKITNLSPTSGAYFVIMDVKVDEKIIKRSTVKILNIK